MARQIYKIGDNIFDAATGVRIPNVETLRANYSGAQEVKPPIQRDGAGFSLGTKTANSTPSGMDSFNNYQRLKDAAVKILEMKNAGNKDLTDSGNYWREIKRDVTPFAGARDVNATNVGTFTDRDFSLMSPSDQASVRLSREGAADAHLQGIAQERLSREKVSGTALGDIKDLYTEQSSQAEKDRQYTLDKWYKEQLAGGDANDKAISRLKDLYSIGVTPTDAQFKEAGISSVLGRSGGSLSWRNNNSGNLKFSDWQTQYGAVKSPESAFAVFPSEEKAREAYKALLTSPRGIYAGLAPNAAMLKWSSDYSGDPRAYNYDKLVKLGAPAVSKPFDKFTNEEWNQFFEAQKKAEGWTVGTELPKAGASANTRTDTQLVADSQALGIPVETIKTMSDSDISAALSSPFLTPARSTDGQLIQRLYGLSISDIAGILETISNGQLNDSNGESELTKLGLKAGAYAAIKKLNEPKSGTATSPFLTGNK